MRSRGLEDDDPRHIGLVGCNEDSLLLECAAMQILPPPRTPPPAEAFAAPAEVPAFPDIDSKTDTERRLYESQDFYGAQFSPDEARAFLANQTGMNDFSVPRGL